MGRAHLALTLALALALASCRSDGEATPPEPAAAASAAADEELPAARTFSFALAVDVPAPPERAYHYFTADVGRWWDHTFAASPRALVLEAVAGGAFYEVMDERGAAAEHARVITAIPGELLRMVGPLGLAGAALELVCTLRFSERPGGARVDLEVAGMGAVDRATAGAIEAVWRHFLEEAYRPYVEAAVAGEGAEAAPEGAPRAARPLYRQGPRPEASAVGRGFYSHIDRGSARNHQHVDDFRLDRPARLAGLRWWGMSERGEGPGVDNISDFTVRVLAADPQGEPGAVIYEQTFALAATGPEATGRRPRGRRAGQARGPEHVHHVEFARPLELAADTAYFLGILAHRRDPAGDRWLWADGEDRDRIAYSRPLDGVEWQRIIDVDSAFELIGEAPAAP
ncbi:MAG: SRPBCC domain-containing protein [Myxococcales bacterium]|nr:SRPBCC domain-containing protein [Myxococcales bacterium]